MPVPTTFSCTRCGCEAAAAESTLVQAMGWLVLPFANAAADGAALACLCALCRRTEASDARSRARPPRGVRAPGAYAPAIS